MCLIKGQIYVFEPVNYLMYISRITCNMMMAILDKELIADTS